MALAAGFDCGAATIDAEVQLLEESARVLTTRVRREEAKEEAAAAVGKPVEPELEQEAEPEPEPAAAAEKKALPPKGPPPLVGPGSPAVKDVEVAALLKAGLRCEAVNRSTTLVCVATIKAVKPDRGEVLVHLDGHTEKYEYWTRAATSGDVRHVGWCSEHSQVLQAPKSYREDFGKTNDTFEWPVTGPAPFPGIVLPCVCA